MRRDRRPREYRLAGIGVPAVDPSDVSDRYVTARAALAYVNRVRELRELAIPPGNRLEALRGTRRGHHSIRINDQFRICFRWEDGYADDVEVTDYR
jgi:proteic killer suppression protein